MDHAINEFASLAANALRDITDPDATVHAADEALASLEQSCGYLPLTHRCQGRLVARTLYQMHSKQPTDTDDCGAWDALRWLECACRWAAIGATYENGVGVGANIERSASVVDVMGPELRELRELLRAVIATVKCELSARAVGRAA